MIEAVRWTISLALGGLSALIILGNWSAIIGALISNSRKTTSLVLPFLCGPACAVACLVCPAQRVRSLAWLPLLLDPSILLGLPAMMFYGLARLVSRPAHSESDPRIDRPE
jgi:hypothetical protein